MGRFESSDSTSSGFGCRSGRPETSLHRNLDRHQVPCYRPHVTETLTIQLPAKLARDFRAKTRAARTNPAVFLRRAAADYVRGSKSGRRTMQEHIDAYAGTWDGYCSGEELLRRTRP